MPILAKILLSSCVVILVACTTTSDSSAEANRSKIEMYGVIDVGAGHSEIRR